MHTTIGSDEYKRMLARWRALTQANDERGLTLAEGGELQQLGRALHAAELRGPIAQVTDDYAQLRQMGDLGGVELL